MSTINPCALRAAQDYFEREIAPCPRSPEWKHGARRGVWRAFGIDSAPSPYASGTAQDDAFLAGMHACYFDAKHHLRGQQEARWEQPPEEGQA